MTTPLRLLRSDWREDLSPEDKAAIQAANREATFAKSPPYPPIISSGYRYFVQIGKPPHVALAWMDDHDYRRLQQCAAGMSFE